MFRKVQCLGVVCFLLVHARANETPVATKPSVASAIAPSFLLPPEESTEENGKTENALSDILQVEKFKSFMASPPVVAHLIFSERLPPDPKDPSRKDIPLTASHAFRFWHGRWQPGGLFLRELPPGQPLSDLTTPGTLSAIFNGQCWFHYGYGVGGGFVDFGGEPGNRVCQTAYLNTGQLRQAVMLGLMRSEPGSIQWQGDHFQSASSKGELRARGELLRSANSLVDSLRVIYTDDTGEVNWLVRYSRESVSNVRAPLVIRCFWLDGSQEIQRDEFTIYSLHTRAALLPLQSFHPEGIESLNRWQFHVFTNNSIYALLPNGKLWLLEKSAPPGPPERLPGQPTSGQLKAVYSFWAGMNLSIFILASRMISKPKKN